MPQPHGVHGSLQELHDIGPKRLTHGLHAEDCEQSRAHQMKVKIGTGSKLRSMRDR